MAERFEENLVVGAGLNVNSKNFPGLTATSLFLECGNIFRLDGLLDKILSGFKKEYLKLLYNKV